jgi:hypothetical protein
MTCLSSSHPIITKRYLVTGNGLSAVIKHKYSKKIVVPITILLLGADIDAMAASIRLLFPYIPVMVATISFSAFIILSDVFVPYKKHIQLLLHSQ